MKKETLSEKIIAISLLIIITSFMFVFFMYQITSDEVWNESKGYSHSINQKENNHE